MIWQILVWLRQGTHSLFTQVSRQYRDYFKWVEAVMGVCSIPGLKLRFDVFVISGLLIQMKQMIQRLQRAPEFGSVEEVWERTEREQACLG